MGLISRVSSRTYRFGSDRTMFARALANTLSKSSRRGVTNFYAADFSQQKHVLQGANLEGCFKVWIGFLRMPPMATTGYDSTLSFAWAATGFFFAFLTCNTVGLTFAGKRYVSECVRVNVRPQMETAKCQTTEERMAYMENKINNEWMPRYYSEDDDEEEDDE